MPKDLAPQSKPDLNTLNWEDPFQLENQLGEEERMICGSARAFRARA
ncbi:hypothetical protein [Parasedimentitalea denitrificans]|nr:hypothetical protein [Sedimentitalea sp. CY04]